MTHHRRWFTLLVGAVALTASAWAQAQQAQTTKWANLRAGPAREYPLVAQLPPASPVLVQGCIANYSWCDVLAPGDVRGWVYAGNLVYPYQGGSVPIIQYGPNIGLPIVTFMLGAYWTDFYPRRPWYGDRQRWDDWHQHHNTGPRQPRLPAPPFQPGVRPPPPHGPGIRPAPPAYGPGVRPAPPAHAPTMRPPTPPRQPAARAAAPQQRPQQQERRNESRGGERPVEHRGGQRPQPR